MQATTALATDRVDTSLTAYVADFVLRTRASDIPDDVAHLGKRSVLDGVGLAFAGAASETGRIARRYLASLSLADAGGSTVIGGARRLPARFAAFANGISIHADDYDDTQLAVAEDRVYGLLTHPTAPVLPAALAAAETRSLSGKELLLAYNVGVEANARLRRRSIRVITKMVFTPQVPRAPWAQRWLRPRFADSIGHNC